jgi:2-methylfumaryl-CoA isomerase
LAAIGAAAGLDLAKERDRFKARDAITAVLAPWFAARRVEDFAAAFDRAGVTWSLFRTFKEAVEQDPDLSPANPMFTTLDQPGIGTFAVPGTPFRSSLLDREPPRPAPRLGEHTDAILAEVAGLDEGEIARLHDQGIVQGP